MIIFIKKWYFITSYELDDEANQYPDGTVQGPGILQFPFSTRDGTIAHIRYHIMKTSGSILNPQKRWASKEGQHSKNKGTFRQWHETGSPPLPPGQVQGSLHSLMFTDDVVQTLARRLQGSPQCLIYTWQQRPISTLLSLTGFSLSSAILLKLAFKGLRTHTSKMVY